VANAAYVVRPDGYLGYLGFRCEPPDADWLPGRLQAIGIEVSSGPGGR
jgi:hypothetical protein